MHIYIYIYIIVFDGLTARVQFKLHKNTHSHMVCCKKKSFMIDGSVFVAILLFFYYFKFKQNSRVSFFVFGNYLLEWKAYLIKKLRVLYYSSCCCYDCDESRNFEFLFYLIMKLAFDWQLWQFRQSFWDSYI